MGPDRPISSGRAKVDLVICSIVLAPNNLLEYFLAGGRCSSAYANYLSMQAGT